MSNVKYADGIEVDGNNNYIKHSLNKQDHDLYDETKDVANKVYRIKRFQLPNKGERWKIFEDEKVVFVLEGIKLSAKERTFLHTADGINCLLKEAKSGIKSFNSLRKSIKDCLKQDRK